MKGALWSVALAFAIVLQVAADIPIQPDFDISKVEGKWHSFALVMNRGRLGFAVGYKATMVPQEDGDLIISREVPEEGTCENEDAHLFHTDEPGKFTTKKNSIIRVVETDYDNYYMPHVETKVIKALHLYTREPEASDDVKEKFKNVATSLGFKENRIVYLTKPDPCPE